MYIKVMYFKDEQGDYGGRPYTYATELPLKVGDKVLAPTVSGDKKALVTQAGVPEGEIDIRWADKIKSVTAYDNGEVGNG